MSSSEMSSLPANVAAILLINSNSTALACRLDGGVSALRPQTDGIINVFHTAEARASMLS